MRSMICDLVNDIGIMTDQVSATPAAQYLFDVDEKEKPLDKHFKEWYHSRVAKALYLAKRGRPDILTAVAFLSTRVQNSTEQDMKKLIKLGKYLNGTKDMLITLGVEKPLVLHCYVNASYSVHRDGKSHSGGFTTLGRGAIRASSRKQTIVSKSSTEAEVVGMSDNTGDNLGYCVFPRRSGIQNKTYGPISR